MNYKFKLAFFVLLFCFHANKLLSQNSYSLKFYNNSDEVVISWLYKGGRNEMQLDFYFKEHFFTRYGDNSLADLLWHSEFYKFNKTPTLQTLLVWVKPHGTVEYKIEEECEHELFCVPRIVIIRKSKFENFFGTANRDWFYNKKKLYVKKTANGYELRK